MIQPVSLRADACLGPVRGAYLAGWATGVGPYRLCIDGGEVGGMRGSTMHPKRLRVLSEALPAGGR